MPSFKGITLGVISQWELQKHPEFKHPDSSQYSSPLLDISPLSAVSSKSDRILGRHSTIAVYIPSVSGARFWIRYGIDETAAAASPWFYFKLFMNGRLITCWGVNSVTQSKGQVMRALFDPSERWNYRGADGRVIQKGGCEVRPFFFAKEDRERSAAEDGGLIEVTVFRALGRRRMMPKPHEFRSQDQFGIIMPTGGLLDKPQDAKCYDWHLRDPKDRPLATFQFHYRSWDSLISSQLIPADYPRKLLSVSPSLLSLNGHPREQQSPPKAEDESQTKICVDEIEQEAESTDSGSSTSSITPWLTTVFEDKPDPGAKNLQNPALLFNLRGTVSAYPLRHSADVPISKFSQAGHIKYRDRKEEPENYYADPVKRLSRPATPGTRDAEWAGIIDRPLPDIPTRNSSLNHGRSRGHSRASSATSNAVSITPSLRSYFNRDTNSPEPAFVGVASAMNVIVSTFVLKDDPKPEKKDISLTSREKPETDAPLNVNSTNLPKRPVGGVFDVSNITLRKHRRSSPTKPISLIIQSPVLEAEPDSSTCKDSERIKDLSENNADVSLLATDNNTTTVSVSESEWMCQTPSPASIGRDKGVRIWSPGGEKHSIRNSLDGVLRKKAGNVNIRASEDFDERSMVAPGDENGGIKMGSGNWI